MYFELILQSIVELFLDFLAIITPGIFYFLLGFILGFSWVIVYYYDFNFIVCAILISFLTLLFIINHLMKIKDKGNKEFYIIEKLLPKKREYVRK